jgi:biopolymer transport protein ExbD
VSAARAPLGSGLYFIDVLACLLFCLTLVLVDARFGTERSVEVDLPPLGSEGGGSLTGRTITLRGAASDAQLYLDDELVTLEMLEARLRAAPPPSVVVRSEATPLARVVAIAHEAGVHDIELAYERATGGTQ